jgi:antitoxin component of MazEF toxin-antitoxin module
MVVEVFVRKWGNSFGVVFPKDFVNEKGIQLNEKILVDVVKEANMDKVFGTLKSKVSGQDFKDEVRKGWN